MKEKFKDLKIPAEIRKYLLTVLGRTGGKKLDNIKIYHYTNIESLIGMIQSGYIWLATPKQMNDYFESEIIASAEICKNLYFTSFSLTEENIAMYKMYAPNPNGVMLSFSFSDAKEIIQQLEMNSNGKKIAPIVRNKKVIEESVEIEPFWASVAYKDLHSNKIRCGTVYNSKIDKPMEQAELAGLLKLYGWSYENELRLCAKSSRNLNEGDRIAIRIPNSVIKNLSIVLCPNFDKKQNTKNLTTLKVKNLSYRDSEYDSFIDLRTVKYQIPKVDSFKLFTEKMDGLITELESSKITEFLNLSSPEHDRFYNHAKKIISLLVDINESLCKLQGLVKIVKSYLPNYAAKYFDERCTWHLDNVKSFYNALQDFLNEHSDDFEYERKGCAFRYESFCNMYATFKSHLRNFRDAVEENFSILRDGYYDENIIKLR